MVLSSAKRPRLPSSRNQAAPGPTQLVAPWSKPAAAAKSKRPSAASHSSGQAPFAVSNGARAGSGSSRKAPGASAAKTHGAGRVSGAKTDTALALTGAVCAQHSLCLNCALTGKRRGGSISADDMRKKSADPADHKCEKGRITMNRCRVISLNNIIPKELSKAEYLYVRENLLAEIGPELTEACKLKQLDASQNEISSLENFPVLGCLRYLQLSGNWLESIGQLPSMPNLEVQQLITCMRAACNHWLSIC